MLNRQEFTDKLDFPKTVIRKVELLFPFLYTIPYSSLDMHDYSLSPDLSSLLTSLYYAKRLYRPLGTCTIVESHILNHFCLCDAYALPCFPLFSFSLPYSIPVTQSLPLCPQFIDAESCLNARFCANSLANLREVKRWTYLATQDCLKA